jgi:hypothetical protein
LLAHSCGLQAHARESNSRFKETFLVENVYRYHDAWVHPDQSSRPRLQCVRAADASRLAAPTAPRAKAMNFGSTTGRFRVRRIHAREIIRLLRVKAWEIRGKSRLAFNQISFFEPKIGSKDRAEQETQVSV